MKKLLTGLLALLMLLSSVFVLSSCAKKPDLDLEDAKDALEDADYIVYYEDDSDTTSIEEMLSARKDEYSLTIIKFEKSSTAKLAYQELKMEHEYEIEALKLEIKSTKHMLSKYEKDLSSAEIDSYEDDIKEMEKELEELQKETVIGRSGKYVWTGDLKAVEATK